MIVEGAVGMVEMALAKLSENKIVDLDEERKASMGATCSWSCAETRTRSPW
jgi:hypothetical protein